MEFIKQTLDVNTINLYPLGDLHIGSPLHNPDAFQKWYEDVQSDPNGFVVLVGDLMDIGIKSSKSSVYNQTTTVKEQKKELVNLLEPISHKILGCVTGNHEERITKEIGDCPTYDVLSKLDLEDLYRPNLGFIKLAFGSRKKCPSQKQVYTIGLHHGASKSKVDKFKYAIDGLDVMITGHTHTPSVDFPSKIVLDTRNECIKMVDFVNLVVPSFTTYGDYVERAMYMPNSGTKYPVIQLSGSEKEVKVLWK